MKYAHLVLLIVLCSSLTAMDKSSTLTAKSFLKVRPCKTRVGGKSSTLSFSSKIGCHKVRSNPLNLSEPALERKEDIQLSTMTPLMSAVEQGNIPEIIDIIHTGSDVNAMHPITGRTALF